MGAEAVPLECGVGQDAPCGRPAVGMLAVHVHEPRPGYLGERRLAALLLCVQHLAGFNGVQAEAVFPPEQHPFPPGAGTKGA